MSPLNILFLGYADSPLIDFLREYGERVEVIDEKITTVFTKDKNYDFLISYGYHYIIPPSVLHFFPKGRAVNLHISLLPWNRGAHPNLWSIYDKTPTGVTIHCLDDGIDTGDIIVQRRITLSPQDTLRSSYERLHREIQSLFKEHWSDMRDGKCAFTPQPPGGSFHLRKNLDRLLPHMPQGWDTPISAFKTS